MKFKEGRQPDLAGWIDCALESFGAAPVPGGSILVRALGHKETSPFAPPSSAGNSIPPVHHPDSTAHLNPPGHSIPPHQHNALHSAEAPHPTDPSHHPVTTHDPAPHHPTIPLHEFALALADEYHLNYHPLLLQKTKQIHSLKGFSRIQRPEMLNGLYQLNPAYAATLPSSAHRSWLILDDILTTGATMKAIIHEIKKYFPQAYISVFTLAKGISGPVANHPSLLKGKKFQLETGFNWMASTPLF